MALTGPWLPTIIGAAAGGVSRLYPDRDGATWLATAAGHAAVERPRRSFHETRAQPRHRNSRMKNPVVRDSEKVAERWGRPDATWCVGGGCHWLEHPAVQRRLNEKASGDAAQDCYRFFLELLRQQGVSLPVERALTLGCGDGQLERGLAKYGFCRLHDACDLAEAAIQRAMTTAAAVGLEDVHYFTADLNRLVLPEAAYDAVLGVSSVHHVARLEHLFEQVHKALRPGAFFFLNEFVGPTRFQWTDRQTSCADHLLWLLPEHLKVLADGKIKERIFRPTPEEVAAADPSEAVRSAEIAPLLERYFEVVERRDVGGTILHPLLEGIVRNFDPRQPEGMRWLQLLFDAEDALLASGEITSDFTVIVARRSQPPS